jgi:hypothetical protein
MIKIHTFPARDPLANFKQTDKPNNYFRVCDKNRTEQHVFLFASSNHAEAQWALEASHSIFESLGGTAGGANVCIWEKCADFHRFDAVGEGAPAEPAATKRTTLNTKAAPAYSALN